MIMYLGLLPNEKLPHTHTKKNEAIKKAKSTFWANKDNALLNTNCETDICRRLRLRQVPDLTQQYFPRFVFFFCNCQPN